MNSYRGIKSRAHVDSWDKWRSVRYGLLSYTSSLIPLVHRAVYTTTCLHKMLLQFNINNLKLKVEGVSEVAKELRIRIEDERKSLELMTFKNYSNLTLSCKNKILRQAFGDWNEYKVHIYLWQNFFTIPGCCFIQNVLTGNAVSTDVDLTLSKVVCLFNHNFPFNFFFFSE